MTSWCYCALEIWEPFTITDNYTQRIGKNRLLAEIVETCYFHGTFDKISKEMLILIHIPSNKHMSCQNLFVVGIMKITEFHQPSPINFDNSPTYTTPQFSMYICETMRYRVSIKLHTAVWQTKKLLQKKLRGLQLPPVTIIRLQYFRMLRHMVYSRFLTWWRLTVRMLSTIKAWS